MASGKLAALRSTAAPKSDKQQMASSVHKDVVAGKVLPDLRTVSQSGVDVSVANKTTSIAMDYAVMATVPVPADGNVTDAWFASLTPQQQAAYRFDYDVTNDLKAADDVATSSLRWHTDLIAIYTVPSKTDASVMTCLLDDWPIPDTTTGNNPAIREEIGPKKDGTTGNIKVDFYNVLAASLAKGKALRSDIESLQAAAPKTGNPAKVKPEHSLLSEDQRVARLTTITKQWQRFRTTIKDAIWIRVQWAAIKAMPLIELDYIYDKTFDPKTGAEISRQITTSTTPFAIWPKGQDTQKIPYSASNFIKLDPTKAMKDGGTLLALRNSVKKSEPPKTPTAAQGVLTVVTIENTYAEQAAFWENGTNSAAMYTKAAKPAGQENAFSDAFVLSFCAAQIAGDPIFNLLKDRYLGLKAQEAKLAQAALAAKAANVGD